MCSGAVLRVALAVVLTAGPFLGISPATADASPYDEMIARALRLLPRQPEKLVLVDSGRGMQCLGLLQKRQWRGGPVGLRDQFKTSLNHDPTIIQALQAMGLKKADWPRIELASEGQFTDGDKQLDWFPAFRSRGDGVIYINPRHAFYLEANGGGADLYPILRLASVIRHEMQHAQADHGEAAALTAQAQFLKQAMIRIPPERRSNAMAYLQSIEKTIPAAREWDRTGRYPDVPR